MSINIQIPHAFKRLSDAIKIHLREFERKHADEFSFLHEKDGFGIELFQLRFARRGYEFYDGSADLGLIRIRQLNTKLTEMLIEDSNKLDAGSTLFLSPVVRFLESDNKEAPTIFFKQEKAKADAKYKRFKAIHRELREVLIESLKHDHLLGSEQNPTVTNSTEHYVARSRIAELRQIHSADFDLRRLVRLCEELNRCFGANSFCAAAALVRTIINHVPPIFGAKNFTEVANNVGGKSVKKSLLRLETASRDISNDVLHQQIQKREVLPTAIQVDFKNELDVLLGEIIRRLG